MRRVFIQTFKYILLMTLSFASGWLLSSHTSKALSPAAYKAYNSIREIPAGETLKRPSPMDEPAWHRELVKVSEETEEMATTEVHQAYVRGYW